MAAFVLPVLTFGPFSVVTNGENSLQEIARWHFLPKLRVSKSKRICPGCGRRGSAPCSKRARQSCSEVVLQPSVWLLFLALTGVAVVDPNDFREYFGSF